VDRICFSRFTLVLTGVDFSPSTLQGAQRLSLQSSQRSTAATKDKASREDGEGKDAGRGEQQEDKLAQKEEKEEKRCGGLIVFV
jgi:hypothetical protein